jgi:hypothetical protein
MAVFGDFAFNFEHLSLKKMVSILKGVLKIYDTD